MTPLAPRPALLAPRSVPPGPCPTNPSRPIAVAALILAAAFGGACGQTTVKVPVGALETERKGYETARDASDTSAIALDAAALALRARTTAEADRRAELCQGTGEAYQQCQHDAARKAIAERANEAELIDRAAKLQRELSKRLGEYEECAPGMGDRLCQLAAMARVAEAAKDVRAAVEAARKTLRNERKPVSP